MERFVADHDRRQAQPYLPPREPATGQSVLIVGAGPAGLAAADFLLRAGHGCTVADRHDEAGGSLRQEVTVGTLPQEVLASEIEQIRRLGAQFMLGFEAGRDHPLESLVGAYDAVLLTTGELARGAGAPGDLAVTPTGLKVDPVSSQTCLPGVFAAGSAVRPIKPLVRAMSEGVAAAACVHRFLSGAKCSRAEKPFSSVMGRLQEGEVNLFMVRPSPAGRVRPSGGPQAGYSDKEAPAEAARCLHCDCRAAGHCQLQRYSQIYGADPGRFRVQRRRFEQHLQHGDVIFEPGKCIVCGICVHLTQQASEPLGLTFIGRGFDVRVGAPLNHTISEGLQKVAAECVEACPTGALAFKGERTGLNLPCHGPAAGPSKCHGCGPG
jgi:ferredoxin